MSAANKKISDDNIDKYKFSLVYLVYKKGHDYRGYSVVECLEDLVGFSVVKYKQNKYKYYELQDESLTELVAVIKDTSGKLKKLLLIIINKC